MITTVKAVARARKGASATWSPSALNDSSGPYDDDDSPSAPRPTQARNATSDKWWKTPGSSTLRGLPTSHRRTRLRRGEGSMGGSGDGSALLGSTGGPAGSSPGAPWGANRPGFSQGCTAPGWQMRQQQSRPGLLISGTPDFHEPLAGHRA